MGKYFSAFVILTSFCQLSFSQLKGKVLDSVTATPVPGATVIYSEDGDGTVSRADGTFETPPTGKLIVSAIGYNTSVINVKPGRDHYLVLLEPREYRLQEVVVEAFNRSRRLIDVPGSLTLISPGQIEREKPVTVVPLLNQASGVFAHSGALNTSRITIRGIGARVPYATGKVRAYLNNIPLTNGSGISIVEDIDPALMERIEIIKGPATSVYGAGLGGTIVITARDPLLNPAGVSNSFQTGSWDLYRNTISVDAGSGNFGLNLQYNHTRSEGYRQNNEYRRDGLTAISRLNTGRKTDITMLMAYTSLKAHIPSSIDSLTYATQPRSAAQNWLRTRGYEDYDKILAGISASYNINPALSANLSVFSTVNTEMEMRPFDVLYEDRLSAGTRLKLTYTRPLPSGSLQLLSGTELYTENFKYASHENIGGLGERGGLISDNDEQISYYNIFAQTDLDLQRLNLSAGINLNSSRTNYRDLFHTGNLNPSGIYSYGLIFSPRLSANYRYYGNNSLFLTVSHGFSPPSLSETLTPDGFINPDIMPEKSWNVEGGVRGNLLDHRVFYDLNIYRMQVRNLLVAERVGEDAWVGRNAGESIHRGIEAELQIYVIRNSAGNRSNWLHFQEVSIRPNMTVNRFRFSDFIDNDIDHSGNLLPGIPNLMANANLFGKLHGGLYGFVNLRHVGSMPMNDANSRFTDPYRLINLTIGYENMIFGRFQTDLHVSLRNVFNTRYPSMILVNAPSFGNMPPRYYYPGLPVNFTTGLKLSYRFN
jgi:iron complex outermembrane recepter protein